MVDSHQQIHISRELAGKLGPLAICVFLVISLIIPGSYGVIEYRRLHQEAGTYSKQLAEIIKKVAASSPKL